MKRYHPRLFPAIFLLFFVSSTLFVSGDECPGVADYKKTKNNQPRMTSIYDGNFTIQTLMTLTEPIYNTICTYVSREGVVRAYAMKYAVSKFNDDPKYAEYARIGLQIDDVCGKLPTTMARGIEVISFHRPNSVCRADFLKCDAVSSNANVKVKKASALIGTARSYTAIPLASLMSLYTIPQVSHLSSSRLLSKKELYKSFFRTIPSDSNQIKVMLDIFKRMDWNYIFAIGSDDDYGKLGVSELKKEAINNEVCITKDEYIPFQSTRTDDKVEAVVQKIKNEPKAKVVVLFLYVIGLGDKILQEAEKQGVERIWLTSETWNPGAAIELSKPTNLKKLKDQAHGILSVSLKKYPMQYLLDYMEHDIKTNWKCNMWFQSYMENEFRCEIVNMTSNFDLLCKNNKTVLLKDVMLDLKKLPGTPDRLIDATTALGYAIHRAIKKECGNEPCYIEDLKTKDITTEMFSTNFVNKQNETISFDSKGDPLTAHYTIENLVFNNQTGLLEYIPVGSWTSNSSELDTQLILDEEKIQWPYWFNYSRQLTDETKAWVNASHPSSRCSDRCQKGFKVVGKSVGKCCWDCHRCTGNNRTNKIMQEECSPCGNYHYTIDNIHCIKTPIKWLEIDNAAGISVVAISALGFLASIASCLFMLKFWPLVSIHEKSPHLLTFVCILLLVTFAYGPLHILEPTDLFCSVRNGYFFVLLMIYTSFVLTKTQAMCGNLQSYCDKIFCGNMTMTQIFVLFLFTLLEIASIVAWIYLDEKQIREFRYPGVHLIEKQCEVEFTAARLVSTFIPCIILIIGTFCAFRERNADHSFYEPKFLSFSCIALCIIIVAFLPTFKYVDGMYKAVVLAFTMNVFGYTFIACFILPKVYVGIIRQKRGIQEYPMKPGITKKEKKEIKEKKKQEKEAKKKKKQEKEKAPVSNTMSSSFKTKSTSEEGITDMKSNRDTEAALDAVKIEEREVEENQNEKGFTNDVFEADDEAEIQSNSPPPSYECSMKDKEEAIVVSSNDENAVNTKC